MINFSCNNCCTGNNSCSHSDSINKSIYGSKNRTIITNPGYDLRGYDKKTWIDSIYLSNTNTTTTTDATSSCSNLTVSSVIGHSYCPLCAYRSFKEHSFTNTIQSIRGQIDHFIIEQFLAKETDFIYRYKEHDSKLNLFLDYIEDIKRKTKERFGFIYDKLGGKFEDTWDNTEYILKRRFSKLLIQSEKNIPKRKFEVPIRSNEIGLRGRLDVLEDNKFPLEIKTGKAPVNGYYLSHAIQIALYALILENKHSIDINEGCIYYSSIDEKRIITIDDKLRRKALDQRNAALRTFNGEHEPEGKCSKCLAQYTLFRIKQNNSRNAIDINARKVNITAKVKSIEKFF